MTETAPQDSLHTMIETLIDARAGAHEEDDADSANLTNGVEGIRSAGACGDHDLLDFLVAFFRQVPEADINAVKPRPRRPRQAGLFCFRRYALRQLVTLLVVLGDEDAAVVGDGDPAERDTPANRPRPPVFY